MKKNQNDDLQDDEENQDKPSTAHSFFDRMSKFFKNLMIEPKNRKLRNFHLVLAISFYLDFFLTGFIIGNYAFLHNPDHAEDDFLYHENVYLFVIFVQATDILLNFFKI